MTAEQLKKIVDKIVDLCEKVVEYTFGESMDLNSDVQDLIDKELAELNETE